MSTAAILQQQQVGRGGSDADELWFSAAEIAQVIGCSIRNVAAYWPPIARRLRERGLDQRPCAIAALATIGVEVTTFAPIHEIGGEAYFFRMYDPGSPDPERRAVARDLGNVFPGDGARYHGRGFIQLTGRGNYRAFGRRLGVPLEDDPDLALDPQVAGAVLVEYFVDRDIPRCAVRGDWQRVRRLVNGGLNGWDRFVGLVRRFESLAARRVGRPGRLRFGQVIERATNGHCTDQGTHGGWPAADIFAPQGTPIYAPCGGWSSPDLFQFGGFATTIRGDDGRTYYLAHGAEPFVGGRVEQGQRIGSVGSTGTGPGGFTAGGGTDPHLHLAVADDGNINRGHRGGSGNCWIEPWVWGH